MTPIFTASLWKRRRIRWNPTLPSGLWKSKSGGYPRLCLNGKPYFFHGLLDQGYWPEGLLTAPAPESYADDILAMKRLGFNTLRKHIKVEP